MQMFYHYLIRGYTLTSIICNTHYPETWYLISIFKFFYCYIRNLEYIWHSVTCMGHQVRVEIDSNCGNYKLDSDYPKSRYHIH